MAHTVLMDTQEQVHQRLAQDGIMGTTRWFRANVEEVVFRAGVGARELRQTVMQFLRYIPEPAKQVGKRQKERLSLRAQ